MAITTARPWLTSYAEGVPSEIEQPEGSLYDLIRSSVQQYPDHAALEFFERTTTYAELGAQIERAAEGLRLLGVQKGDPVALVLPNCPQHIVAFYAVLRLGAIVVEHNPLYTPRELRHQFEDHGARVVIAWDKVVETIQAFPADVSVAHIVSVDVTRAMPFRMRAMLRLPIAKARESRAALTTKVRDTVRWEELAASAPIDPHIIAPTVDDIALIQYTSGTTGSPKGATLTHANLLANAAQARAWVPGIERGSSVVYAVLPMFHAYGLTLCLTFAMSMGARLVLFPRFDPDLVLKVVKRHPPTFLPAVPPIYDRLTKAAAAEGVSLDGISIAISGAMPLSAEVVEPWEAQTHGYLVEGYGLSETSPVLMANPVAPNRRAGTVGLPLPSTEVRVVDPEAPGTDVAAGAEGELIVRGPQVFSGYWRKPEETEAVFVPATDGGADWFRTGDSCASMPTGSSASSTASRSSSSRAASTSRRARSKRPSEHTPTSRTAQSSASPTSTPASRSWLSWCCATVPPSTRPPSAPSPATDSPPTRCRSAWCRPTTCHARSSARCCAATCATPS